MKVHKTIKLYIGGEFPRTESGRSFALKGKNGKEYARICQASRKDLREAVVKAKEGAVEWAKRSAFNRSQVIYRMAEMTEGKRLEFCQLFQEVLGVSEQKADHMVSDAIDSLVYYAGFCDKLQQVSGSVNPINGPFHNFSTPDSMGVVMHIDNDKFDFGKLVSELAAILVSGNSVISLLSNECPAVLAPLAEVFATSDLPKGVVNLLTGHLSELHEFIGGHREIRAVSFQYSDHKYLTAIQKLGAENMKRVIKLQKEKHSLDNILSYVEFKTVWHPIGY